MNCPNCHSQNCEIIKSTSDYQKCKTCGFEWWYQNPPATPAPSEPSGPVGLREMEISEAAVAQLNAVMSKPSTINLPSEPAAEPPSGRLHGRPLDDDGAIEFQKPSEPPTDEYIKRVTKGVREMLSILEAGDTTEDERATAAVTIVEAVAPDIMEKAYSGVRPQWDSEPSTEPGVDLPATWAELAEENNILCGQMRVIRQQLTQANATITDLTAENADLRQQIDTAKADSDYGTPNFNEERP